MDILRTLVIGNWQSEGYQQCQNPAERGHKNMKEWVNNLLNRSGAPPELWLLALQCVCFLRNHLAHKSLGWRTPTEWLFGFTPDTSVLLQFIFYEPVYYKRRAASFTGDSDEVIGHFVGVSEHVGHRMTFRILTDTGHIVNKAVVRSAMGPHRNLRLEPINELEEEELNLEERDFKESFHENLKRDLSGAVPAEVGPLAGRGGTTHPNTLTH